MQVAIASRIFDPEPSAASFRLGVLAAALAERGHSVTVLTVRPPRGLSAEAHDAQQQYRVRRFPVLRDRAGYVRGYLQYLSFDVPLFLRVLFGRRRDVIVVEPPPTTGLSVRIAAAIRRIPYVYYAADIWSDGAGHTGAPKWVVGAVRTVERSAMSGAAAVLSVSDSLTVRLGELEVSSSIVTVGNGVDPHPFRSVDLVEEDYRRATPHEFVYAGTASEWHGSVVFVEALPQVLRVAPDVRIRFIGGGTEFAELAERAAELGVSQHVTLEPFVTPSVLAPILRGATAALASIRAGSGNEFTFPTKLYASTLTGTPAVFAGVGPAVEFLRTEIDGSPLGLSTQLDPGEVASAMIGMLERDDEPAHRMRVSEWGVRHVSLTSVAEVIARELEQLVRR